MSSVDPKLVEKAAKSLFDAQEEHKQASKALKEAFDAAFNATHKLVQAIQEYEELGADTDDAAPRIAVEVLVNIANTSRVTIGEVPTAHDVLTLMKRAFALETANRVASRMNRKPRR